MGKRKWNTHILTWNHAWGAAPANILSRFVLGVRPLTPGSKTILIAPQPGPLAWVKGRVPTARGPVNISLQNDGQSFQHEVEIPAGSIGRIQIPSGKNGAPPASKPVLLDGKPAPVKLDHGMIIIPDVPPGKHLLVIS